MMTLRCTRTLLDLLDREPAEEPPASTTALGDWYANDITTPAGDLIVFVNELSLLSVALPLEAIDGLIPLFVTHVYNLLLNLDISIEVTRLECARIRPVTYAKTASRTVLGCMGDIALGYYMEAETAIEAGVTPRLTEAELKMSRRILSPLEGRLPVEVARSLLAEEYGDISLANAV
jgi:hypothetical protein